jgi:hypothetical protein
LLLIAKGIINGMTHLAQFGIVHRDLGKKKQQQQQHKYANLSPLSLFLTILLSFR